jgi:hypothetical protein
LQYQPLEDRVVVGVAAAPPSKVGTQISTTVAPLHSYGSIDF